MKGRGSLYPVWRERSRDPFRNLVLALALVLDLELWDLRVVAGS